MQPKAQVKSDKVTSGGYILSLALLYLSCMSTAFFGQTVAIPIVNATNHEPVKSVQIYVSGIAGKPGGDLEERLRLVRKPITTDLSLTTGANGEVEVRLPKPAPAQFFVRAMLSGRDWDCTCLVTVSTNEVMQKGRLVTSPSREREPPPTIQPKPGEVLFALTPTPWWVRLLWPLLKG